MVVVVGAGAAGIIAAWRAASLGAPTVLLEKNERIGTKILISGGGKCNITHDGPIETVLAAFRSNEARFLRPSCYRFTNADIVRMLVERGLAVYTRPDGRIFPQHGTARDVVAILRGFLDEAGVRLKLGARVSGVEAAVRSHREEIDGSNMRDRTEREVLGVRLGEQRIEARSIVLAVGGSSYPGTGATGDGYPWVRELGHTVVRVRAALAPIFIDPAPPADWAGVALRDATLKARQSGAEVARARGDLLFTHRGVSGPAVLDISRAVAELQSAGPILLDIDLLPDATFEQLGSRVRKWAAEHPRRTVASLVEEIAPNRLAEAILAAAEVPGGTAGAYLSRKAQNRVVAILKAWPIGRAEHVPLEKGEVVAGGVALDEVDPHTMRSRTVRGLYLCGEILDVAGPVGGYNLQAAFSTGFVAGETAARDWLAGR